MFVKNISVKAVKQVLWLAVKSTLRHSEGTRGVLTIYIRIVNHHLTTRNVKIRCKSLPWISIYMRKQINVRYKLLKEAKSSQDEVKWELYKSKRNEGKKVVKTIRSCLLKTEFGQFLKDPKQFWKLTNKVLRKSKDSTIGPIITDSKDILTSDLEKASYFDEFFINISDELTKNLEPLDPNTFTSYVTRSPSSSY